MIYKKIISKVKNSNKLFAVLIDPENIKKDNLVQTVKMADSCMVDMIFVGGSLVSENIDKPIEVIKSLTQIPVLLFPGSLLQISGKADGILLLSLISGRNPEYLIGNHVQAAPLLKKLHLEIIPTAYLLTGNADVTAVGYISNTTPIPYHKTDLLAATAMAGEMLGNRLIYLEAGSGAANTLPPEAIKSVKENISVPLIVGGGFKTSQAVSEAYQAGADIVVIGNALEKDRSLLEKVSKVKFSL